MHYELCIRKCGWGDSNPHGFRHQILSLARLPLRHIRGFFEGAKVHFFSTRATGVETSSEFTFQPGESRLGDDASKRRRAKMPSPMPLQAICIVGAVCAGDSPTLRDGRCFGALTASSTDTECQNERKDVRKTKWINILFSRQ